MRKLLLDKTSSPILLAVLLMSIVSMGFLAITKYDLFKMSANIIEVNTVTYGDIIKTDEHDGVFEYTVKAIMDKELHELSFVLETNKYKVGDIVPILYIAGHTNNYVIDEGDDVEQYKEQAVEKYGDRTYLRDALIFVTITVFLASHFFILLIIRIIPNHVSDDDDEESDDDEE